MPDIIIPVAKKMFVCDDFVQDPSTGKSSPVNFWDAIRVVADDFPCLLEKMCVFARFRGGVGTVPVHIEIVQADTDDLIRGTPNFPIAFQDRTKTYDFKCAIVNLIFPSPGVYIVPLYCNNTFVDDQCIQVRSNSH